MQFNIKNYQKEKQEVINLIKASHKWETTEGFIADGLINPEVYEKQDLKIICFLAESYGYDECKCIDIESQLRKDILGIGNPKVKTSRKIPSLMWILFESLRVGEKLAYEDVPSLFRINNKNTARLQSAMSKIGWINVKKASKRTKDVKKNATRQNNREIYEQALKNKDILWKQMDAMQADLVIVCSHPVFNSMKTMGLLDEEIQYKKINQVQTDSNGRKVMQVYHPSYYRDWGYKGVYEKFETVYAAINQ